MPNPIDRATAVSLAPRRSPVLARIPLDRLVDILDFAEDGIVTINAKHQIVLFNLGATKLFGYEPDEVAGRSINQIIPTRFHASHGGQIAEFGRSPEPAREMAKRREVSARRKDGSEFPAEISISKFVADGEMLFTAIVRDVTDRKQYEAVVRELEELRTRSQLADAEALIRESELRFHQIVEPDALRALCGYDWPGNIRELANVIERAQILAERNSIALEDLPESLYWHSAPTQVDVHAEGDTLEAMEHRHVATILERWNGNRLRAAAALGISGRTLYRLLDKYGLGKRSDLGADNSDERLS